jgi:hypothetical protein
MHFIAACSADIKKTNYLFQPLSGQWNHYKPAGEIRKQGDRDPQAAANVR